MLDNRTRAAAKVAQRLAPAEAGLDAAMSNLVALTHAMLEARTEARVSVVTGQDAFDRVGEATNFLFLARSKLIDAHHCLNRTKTEVGLRTVALGAWQDCPPIAAAPIEPSGNVVAFAS